MPLESRVGPVPQDPALQLSSGPLVAATSGLGFLGLGDGFSGFTMQAAPPDTNGSAGATQYVQWVNLEYAVFNKSNGALEYGPAEGNTLWSALSGSACATSNSGDIIAQYDKQAGRWVMMQPIFTSPYALCVAVSTTSDALGSYNEYEFSIPDGGFPDYPKLAVWPDGYYVSYNDFGPNGNSFISAYACALDRSAMLAGNSAGMQCFSAGGYASILPSDLDGDSGAPGTTAAPPSGSPDYYIDFSSTSGLNLWQFHVDWTTPANSTFTGPVSVSGVDSFSEACGGGVCIPQEGTNTQLDSLGDRLMYRFAYRNFGTYRSLVVSQSVDTGNGNTGIRWYEIRNPSTGPAVYQQGTFAPDSNYRWMPSIAEDEAGDIALGYSVSSSTMSPSISFTGRVPSDPLGTMESENSIVTGSGYQSGTSNRWGDYSDISVDPTDDCTFWYTTEYVQTSGSFNWSTRIASFKFPNCGTPGISLSAASPTETLTAGDSTTDDVSVTPTGNFTGSVTLSVTGGPTGMTTSFSTNTVSITGTSAVSSTLNISSLSTLAANTYDLTVTGTGTTSTGSQVSSSTTVAVVVQAPPTPSFSISSSPGTNTVTEGGSAKYTIGITPTNGYTGTVNLSQTGLPSSAVSFGSTSINVTGTTTVTTTLTVNTTGISPATYPFTVTGTDSVNSSLTSSVQDSLTVQQPTSMNFTIGVSPAYNAAQPGSSASYTVTVNGSTSGDPYNGTVSLSVSGVPSRTSASFSTTSITGQGSSTLTLSPNKRAPKGTYTLTITGTPTSGNGTQQYADMTFAIGTATTPSFTVSATPSSASITPGQTGNYTVTVTPSGGFLGTVNLAAAASPAGVAPSLGASSVDITTSSSASTSLTVPTATTTATGTYTITVTGSAGSITQTTQVSLAVQSSGGSGSFTITLNPSSQSVATKSSVSYGITVASVNGFSGTVTLSLGTLPARTSGSFSSSSVTVSSTSPGTATLTISTTPKTTPGKYTITVTGTSGSQTVTGSGTLNVT